MEDGWMPKKRDQPQAAARPVRHAKPRQRKVPVITDTDEEWTLRLDPRPCRLTCVPPPSSDVGASVPQPQPTPVVKPKPVVAPPPPSCPLHKYTPLSVRRIPSDEDWLMRGLKPAEE